MKSLTVCVPIYNFSVIDLAESLQKEIKENNFPVDLLFIDDCSAPNTQKEHQQYFNNSKNYIELAQNIGRAKIRNLFLQYTTTPYLLFLDGDSKITTPNFLQTYLQQIKNEPTVVCGGRTYPKQCSSKQQKLSWKYGVLKESKTAKQRQQNPNKSFMTNNFLVRRTVLETIPFDERLSTYGHEDTLFGYQLYKQKIQIKHIENPVLNGDIETNKEFLHKTQQGLLNLIKITSYTEPDFTEFVSLLKFHNKLCKYKLTALVHFLYKTTSPTIKKMLTSGYINLPLFDFYKIGFFIKHNKD